MQAKKPADFRSEEALPFGFNPIQIPDEQIRQNWDRIHKAIKGQKGRPTAKN